MAPDGFQQRLLNLERNKSPPAELISTAADIIGLNLEDFWTKCSSGAHYVTVSSHYAPKEEWVLRWILKHVNEAEEVAMNSCAPTHNTEIPGKNLASILHQKDFLSKGDRSLKILLRRCMDVRVNPASSIADDMSEDDADDRPHKRRKLSRSPSDNDYSDGPSAVTTSLLESSLLVSQIFGHCGKLLKDSDSSTNIELQHLRLTFSRSPETAASVVGNLLSLMNIALEKSAEPQIWIHCATYYLNIWIFRSKQYSPEIANDAFTSRCLRPALTLLQRLSRIKAGQIAAKNVVCDLERCIAIHSILPLRAKFIADFLPKWKSNLSSIEWDHVQEVFETIESHLGHALADDIPSRSPSSSLASLVFDISIRVVPFSTPRQRQQEQAWLEAFFVSLAYLSFPDLPRPTKDEDGTLKESEEQYRPKNEVSGSRLEPLLDVALKHSLRPNLPILSYVMFAIMEVNWQDSHWPLISQVVELDANVILPNSGSANAQKILNRLCQDIDESEDADADHYQQVRIGIAAPLMKAFAQARDLHGLVVNWDRQLARAMQFRAAQIDSISHPSINLVWDDETLFEQFHDVAKTHATPALVQKLASEALKLLASVSERVGTTSDIFSQMAILDAMLTSRPGTIDTDTFTQLLDAASAALQRHSDYQNQRWRLWKFLRHGIERVPSFRLSDNLRCSQSLETKFLSLKGLENMVASQKYQFSAVLREQVECFDLLVSQAVAGDTEASENLRIETGHLITLLKTLTEEKLSVRGHSLKTNWDGTTESLQNPSIAGMACLSVLLKHPSAIALDVKSTSSLCKVLCRCASINGIPSNADDLLTSLFNSECFLSDPQIVNSCFEAVCTDISELQMLSPSAAKFILSKPLQSIKKARIESLVELLLSIIKSGKSQDLALELVLIDRLVKETTVSVARPQKWSGLVSLVVAISELYVSKEMSPKVQSVVIQCIQNIFNTIWRRTLNLPPSEKSTSVTIDMCTWMTLAASKVDDAAFQFPVLALLGQVMAAFWANRKHVPGVASKEVKAARFTYFGGLLVKLGDIEKNGLTASLDVQNLVCTIEALSACGDLCEISGSLKSLASKLDALLTKSVKSHNLADDELSAFARSLGHLHKLVDPNFQVSASELEVAISNGSLSQTRDATTKQSDLQEIATRAKLFMSSISQSALVQLLIRLQNGSADLAMFNRVVLVSVCVKQIETSTKETSPELNTTLMKLATLCLGKEADSSQSLCIAIDCAKSVLRKHQGLINQHVVDSLLSNIAHIASNVSCISVTLNCDAEPIFNRLCSLLSIVLNNFRKRLGGRYHLLVPTLLSLFQVLFCRGSANRIESLSKAQIQFLHSLPSWAVQSKSALPPTSARQLTSILLSICDPPTSAVTKRSKSKVGLLTDDTKKARSIAGQYMQYIVIAYCRYSLEGVLDPENKAELLPGLYAVLDVMTLDGMRAMNASMDAGGRAIFKTLYDSWVGRGSWNG